MSKLAKQSFLIPDPKHEKIVLCAIDFSPSSVQAFKWSVEMARNWNAKLIVLFCYRLIPNPDEDIKEIKSRHEQQAKEKMRSLERMTLDEKAPFVEFIAEVGFYSSRIEEYIRKGSISLLVMSNTISDTFIDHNMNSLRQFIDSMSVPVVVFSDKVTELH